MTLSHIPKALSCIGNRMRSCCVPHLCEIERDRSSPASSSTNTRPHQVPLAVTILLIIIAAACAFGLIVRFFPMALATLRRAFCHWSEATHPHPARGVRAGATQASDLSPATAPPSNDRTAGGAEAVVVSSLAEGISNTIAGSGRRTQTSGVHAASDDPPSPRPSDNLALSVTDDDPRAACPRATPSIDCPGCERCLGSASSARSPTPRGVAPNPVQDERPPPPAPIINAQETIIKSLFPGRDSTEQCLDPVPHSPLAHASQESLNEPVNRTSVVAAGGATTFMLAVAAGADELEDPEVDCNFIIQVFRSAAICLVSLLDDQATRASIRDEFRAMYRRAQESSNSQMLIILMGLGAPSGDMCLPGDTTIGAQDFQNWIGELQAESSHPRPKFGIIFDICRRDVESSNPVLDHDLATVWSCSAGQWAYAFRSGPGLPSSCFLVSLFLAAQDSIVEDREFELAFEYRLAQQGHLLRFFHSRKHGGDNPCDECVKLGRCDTPELQKLERGESGRATLHAIGELIKSEFPDVARRVHAEMTEKMTGWGFLIPEVRCDPHVACGLDIGNFRGSAIKTTQAASDPT